MAVQSTHAAINFNHEHPDRASPWWTNSNYLVQLEVETEKDLLRLIHKAEEKGIVMTIFREPDIGNRITAICLEPSQATKRLTRGLDLLFSKVKINNNEQARNTHIPENNGNQIYVSELYQNNSIQEKDRGIY